MLEQHVIRAGNFDDDREAIEVLDPTLERFAGHQLDSNGQPLSPREVEEDVLNVRLTGADFRLGRVRHQA